MKLTFLILMDNFLVMAGMIIIWVFSDRAIAEEFNPAERITDRKILLFSTISLLGIKFLGPHVEAASRFQSGILGSEIEGILSTITYDKILKVAYLNRSNNVRSKKVLKLTQSTASIFREFGVGYVMLLQGVISLLMMASWVFIAFGWSYGVVLVLFVCAQITSAFLLQRSEKLKGVIAKQRSKRLELLTSLLKRIDFIKMNCYEGYYHKNLVKAKAEESTTQEKLN